MTWAKVDDSFWGHPKVMAAAETPDAIALWVRSLSWCAAYENDGHVPDTTLKFLLPDQTAREQAVKALVDAGLWKRNGSGVVFHDWAKYQPTKAFLKERRAAEAQRQREHRERKANG